MTDKQVSIVDKVFSPYDATITMHPLIYEDLQDIKEELKREIFQAIESELYIEPIASPVAKHHNIELKKIRTTLIGTTHSKENSEK